MFITLEDETGVANLVVWSKVFEAHRRVVLGSGMIGVQGRVQREGEVVHFMVHRITDLSEALSRVGRSDRLGQPMNQDQESGRSARSGRRVEALPPQGPPAREIYIPDLDRDSFRVKGRDFR